MLFSSWGAKGALLERPPKPVPETGGWLSSSGTFGNCRSQSPFFSLWILTAYCSWKKGCLAKARLPSSPRLPRSPRTCMTRGASWWMNTRVGCWNFWAWGIVSLCLGCLRWDHLFMQSIRWEFAILPPSPASAPRRDERALIFFFSASHNPSPKHWVLLSGVSSGRLDTNPANEDRCHSF